MATNRRKGLGVKGLPMMLRIYGPHVRRGLEESFGVEVEVGSRTQFFFGFT